MDNTQFFYLDCDIQNIQGKKYVCIYVLEYSKKCIFKIFKQYSDDLWASLDMLNTFDIIDQNIKFVIKRDGKIALDISL